MNYLVFLLTLSVMATMSSSCSKNSDNTHLQGNISLQDDAWASRHIQVCFEQSDDFTLEKATVRAAVVETFQELGIKFEGFGLCEVNQEGIRIRFAPDKAISQTKDFGSRINGVSAGMILGLSPQCKDAYSGSVCQSNITLHEFGHALGLRHEMNRREKSTCFEHDQFHGEGEEDALQIGDFDPDSIMSYCKLYGANERGEKLSLSKGDQRSLQEKYHGVIASIPSKIPYVIAETRNFKVGGKGVVSFRYQVGPASELNCRNLANYGDELSIDEGIPMEMKPSHSLQKLCLLGKNRNGLWQSIDSYSSVVFYRSKPNTGQPPRLLDQIEYSPRQESGQAFVMGLKIEHEIPIKKISAVLKTPPKDGKYFSGIYNSPLKTVMVSPNYYQLAFDGKDFLVNGEMIMESLSIVDVFGNRLGLDNYQLNSTFFNSKWNVPKIEIEGAVDFKPYNLRIGELSHLPTNLSSNSVLKWRFRLEGSIGIGLNFASLEFKKDNIKFIAKASREGIQNVDKDIYEASFIIPSYRIDGNYQVSRISITDELGSSYSLNTYRGSNYYDGTGIPVLTTTLINGIDYQSSPPRVVGIETNDAPFQMGERYSIYVKIDDDISVNFNPPRKVPTLKLQHRSHSGPKSKILALANEGIVAGYWKFNINLNYTLPNINFPKYSGSYHIEELSFEDLTGLLHSYRGASDGEYFESEPSVFTPSFQVFSDLP